MAPLHLSVPPLLGLRERSLQEENGSGEPPFLPRVPSLSMHYYVWESPGDESPVTSLHQLNQYSAIPPRSISHESQAPLLRDDGEVIHVVDAQRSNEVCDSSAGITITKLDNGCSVVDVEEVPSEAGTPSEYHDQWILAPLAVTILKMKLKKRLPVQHEKKETRMQFFLETLIPFIFAGTGLVFAGLLIAKSREWQFFKETSGALMLVPVLFGLKGNLEMTLASRLSTLANLGFMETAAQKRQVLFSNMALIQVQAIVVSSLAVAITVITLLVDPKENINVTFPRVLHLLVTGVATASAASYVLGALMFTVVCLARRYKINPDNITTPMAASLGDVSTLMFMLGLGTLFLQLRDNSTWILCILIGLFYLSAVVGVIVAYRDQFTAEVLKNGWWAVLTAMLISIGAGFGFEKAMSIFEIGTYQPVINGVGGNLVAVQASRISTYLHWRRKHKIEEEHGLMHHCNPINAFLGSQEDAVAARILTAMAVPGLLVFFGVLWLGSYLLKIPVHITVPFIAGYLLVGLVQVLVLLFVCQWLVRTMWRYRIDPDNSAIPILTALGDLLGQVLLAGCFLIMVHVFGDTQFYSQEHMTSMGITT